MIDQVDACAQGRITREELDRWITERDVEDLPQQHKIPFPRGATQRWIDCAQGRKAEDPLDRAAIGRSREQFMLWYTRVRGQALDGLQLLSRCLEHQLDTEPAVQFLRWFVRAYYDVPWWPPHYASEPEGQPHLTLIDLIQRQIRAFDGPEQGF